MDPDGNPTGLRLSEVRLLPIFPKMVNPLVHKTCSDREE